MLAETCIPIAEIKIGNRYRKKVGDLGDLARSIEDVGLLHPIVIESDNTLIAGWRRLEAVKLLGWTDVPVRIVDLDNALQAEHDENVIRKPFTPSEAVAVADAALEREQELAKERQQAGGRLKASSKLEEPKKARESRTRAAKAAGMSATTLDKANVVVKAAEEDPERFGHVKAEMDRTSKVDPAYKAVMKNRQTTESQLKAIVKATAKVTDLDPKDTAHRLRRGSRLDEALAWAATLESWLTTFVDTLSVDARAAVVDRTRVEGRSGNTGA